MAFDLLGVRTQSPSLYPLYSDIDSDIESNNNDHSNINLMVPASIRRERYPNNNNNRTKLAKTYNYYRSMQNRNRGRGRNRIHRNNNHHYKSSPYNNKSNRDNQYHNKRRRNRNRHHAKSASLSAISIISSPRPNGCNPVSDQEFVYHLTQTKSNSNPTHQNHVNHQNKPNLNTKRSQKRRIRTFYSKKWGNRLYNLRINKSRNNDNKVPQTIRSHSCDIPDMLRVDRYHQHQQQQQHQHQLHRKRSTPDIMNNSQLQLWRNEIDDARKSLSAFIEEENLDLNEIKSVKSISPSPSPSPSISASPMPIHLDVINDFRMDQDSQTVYYDSAASNIASNTDTESDQDGDDDDSNDDEEEEEEEDHMDEIECSPSPDPSHTNDILRDFTPTPAPNININRTNNNNNIGYSHNNHSHVTISRYHEIDNEKPSNFKIIVSAPNNEEIINTNCNHNHLSSTPQGMNTMNTMNDRQNELMSRLKPKRSRRRYIPRVIESGASDDCSSCDDDDMTSAAGTVNEMDDRDDLYSKSSLFLSENNLKRGVYASFGLSDTETDYLSAQSDDFDELTICYHHRNDQDNHRNNNNLNVNHHDKNIRFRNNQMMYLSDIGPSDIGSSDTECFSSNDSIPDSIPPPLHHDDDDDDNDTDDDFVSIN